MAQEIGIAKVVQGQMSASGPSGSHDLHQGSPVFKGDTVVTAKGAAGSIEFLDHTVLNVGEGSKVSLDQYVFDASKGTGKVLFKLAQGTFRTVTGEIVKHNPESFKMQSPLATIGIRGTETAHTIPGPGGGDENHLVMVFDGKPVIVQPLGGGSFQVLSQAGVKVEVGKFGAGPVMVMTPQEFKYYQALTETGIQQQGAPTDTISTGQNQGQTQVKNAQDVAAKTAADAAAKSAAEAAAKSAAEAAAKAAAEAEKGADPAAKAAAEAAAKAAAELAAKAALEAKAAAELAAKAAAEAAAALQAQALAEAAAKAAADLAAKQQLQQQTTEVTLSQGQVFNLSQLTGQQGPNQGQGQNQNQGQTQGTGTSEVLVSQGATTVIASGTTTTTTNYNDTTHTTTVLPTLDFSASTAPQSIIVPTGIGTVKLSNFGDSVSVSSGALGTSITGGAGDDHITYAPGGSTPSSPAVVTGTIDGGGGTDNELAAGAGTSIDFSGATILNIQNVVVGMNTTATFTAAQIDAGYTGGGGYNLGVDFPAHTSDVNTITGSGSSTDGATIIVKDPGSNWYYDFSNISFANWGSADVLDITGSSTYTNLYNLGHNMTSQVHIHGAGGTLEFIPDSDHPGALANVSDISALVFGDISETLTMDPLSAAIAHGSVLTIDTTTMTGGSITLDASALSASIDYYAGAGIDHITATAQDDSFHFGENLTKADTIAGGNGTDTLYFTPDSDHPDALNNVTSVEHVVLGDPTSDVSLVVPGTVAGGQTLTFDASALHHSLTLTVSGAVDFTAGTGDDSITGSAYNDYFHYGEHLTSSDTIYGGAGHNYLAFTQQVQSGAEIHDLDHVDKIDHIVLGDAVTSLTPSASLHPNTSGVAPLYVDASALTHDFTWDGSNLSSANVSEVNFTLGTTGIQTIDAGQSDISYNVDATLHTLTSADQIFASLYGDSGSTLTLDALGGTNALDNVRGFGTIAFTGSAHVVAQDELGGVQPGYELILDASALSSSQSLNFDGSNIESGTLTFIGGAGADTLIGGSGDDTFTMGSHLTSADSLDGGGGSNTLTFTQVCQYGAEVHDLDNVSHVNNIVLGDADTSLTLNTSVAYALQADMGPVTIDGSALGSDHTLTFDASGVTASYLYFNVTGGGGNDSITTGAGDDTINGSTGNDTIHGGDGNDTLLYSYNLASYLYHASYVMTGTGAGTVTFTGDSITIWTQDFTGIESLLTYDDQNNQIALTCTGGHFTGTTGNDNYTGTAVDDTFDFGTHLTSDDTLDGAGGSNTLTFTQQSQGGLEVYDLDHVSNINHITLGDATTSLTLSEYSAEALKGVKPSVTFDGSGITNPAHSFTFDASAVTNNDIAFTVSAGAGEFTLTGGAGNDEFLLGVSNTDNEQQASSIDGGGGTNKLTINADMDLRGVTINNIQLGEGNNAHVIMDASQFDAQGSQLHNSVSITLNNYSTLEIKAGATATDYSNFTVNLHNSTLQIDANAAGGALDLSTLTNVSFDGNDSDNHVNIFDGAGADIITVNGVYDSTVIYHSGDLVSGETLNNASSHTTIQAYDSLDFRDYATIAGFGTLQVESEGAVLKFGGPQLQDLTGLEFVHGGSPVAQTVEVYIDNSSTNIDLSGLSFTGNVAGDKIVFHDTASSGGVHGTNHGDEYHFTQLNSDFGVFGGSGDDTLYFQGLGSTSDLDGVRGIEHVILAADVATSLTISESVAEQLVGSLSGVTPHIDIDASALATHTLTFDASAVTGGYGFYITGSAGNDLLMTGAGNDHFIMGTHLDANDTIDGGLGADVLYFTQQAGSHTDDLSNVHGVETIVLGDATTNLAFPDSDHFNGTAWANVGHLITLDGSALGASHSLTFDGSAVTDNTNHFVLYGGAGDDTLTGGAGDDVFHAGAGNNDLHGGGGNNVVDYSGATGSVTADLDTGTVSDNGYGGANHTDHLYDIGGYIGSNHGDHVTLGANTLSLLCGSGDDIVYGGTHMSNDIAVHGGSGEDTLHLDNSAGSQTDLDGVNGFEHISLEGVSADLVIHDSIFNNTASSSDYLNHWNDMGSTISVDATSLTGSLHFDASGITQGYLYIHGSEQADTITGGHAYCSGSEFTNKIFGGGGADNLTGANGYADMFIYHSQSEGGDTITNFESGTDKLAFYDSAHGGDFGTYATTVEAQLHVYTNLADYNTGAGAGETGPCWYLDDVTHKLMYDADGHGTAHAASCVATLTGVSSISTTDVVVVDASHHVVGPI